MNEDKEIYFEVQVLGATDCSPRFFDIKDLRTGEIFHNVLPDYIKRESPEFLNAHSIIKNPKNMNGLGGRYKFMRGLLDKETFIFYEMTSVEVFNKPYYYIT